MPSQITYGSGDQNASPLQELQNNKYSFDTFSYPPDLFTNPALNHYVCFYINESKNTKFSSTSQIQSAPFSQFSADGVPIQGPDGSITPAVSDNATVNVPPPDEGANNSQNIKRTTTAIALYMPNLVTTDAHTWAGDKLGMANEAVNIGKLFVNGVAPGGFEDKVKLALEAAHKAGGDIAMGLGRSLLEGMGWVTNSNILGALGSGARLAYNAHLEVLYDGPTFREFEFKFKLIPRSVKEAQLIANIIRAFRFYSAPELTSAKNVGRFLVYPAEFDIKFFSNGKPNTFLNKISTCALKNITVDYSSAAGWTAFRPDDSGNLNTNGVPVETNISLSFMEVEIMTKARILQGF